MKKIIPVFSSLFFAVNSYASSFITGNSNHLNTPNDPRQGLSTRFYDPVLANQSQNPTFSGLVMGQGLGMRNQNGESLVDSRLLNMGLAAKNGNLQQTTRSQGLGFVNNKLNGFLGNALPNLETSIAVNEDKKVEFGVLGVQPISNYTENSKDVFLYQGSFFVTNSERYTVNNGLVYRRITDDEKFIYGLNVFYDHEFPYGHKRTSLGGEFKSTILDLNINHYMPISDWTTGLNDAPEKALAGTTFELVTPIPYLPRLNASVMYSKWDSAFGMNDANSMTYGVHGAIYAGLGFEYKRRISEQLGNVTSGMLIYNLRMDNNRQFTKPFFSSTPYIKESMRGRMLEKVRRENTIRKDIGGLVIATR